MKDKPEAAEADSIFIMDTVNNAVSYSRISDRWSRVRDPAPVNKCVADLEKMLKRNSYVLDAGCGTGTPIDVFLSAMGHRIAGIDISERMIEIAESKGIKNAEYTVCDFLEYAPTVRFDAVIAFDSLFHIPPARQRSIYAHAARLLKEEGYFLFTHGKTHGHTEGVMFGEPFSYASLDAGETEELLLQNGFDIIEFTRDYEEATTGTRDLLVLARKRKSQT